MSKGSDYLAHYTFAQSDFEIFDLPDLDSRMNAIKELLQPKFQLMGQDFITQLQPSTNRELFLHIAKHARRKVNPPKDTWLAINSNKRGYKQHPHFEVGLFDDRVFIWLSFIYELPTKGLLANSFLDNITFLEDTIPDTFEISQNHMQKGTLKVNEIDLQTVITQFKDIKRSELLIGRQIMKNDPILQNSNSFNQTVLHIFETLLPIYTLALDTIEFND